MRSTIALFSLMALAFVGCEKKDEKKAVDHGAKKVSEMTDGKDAAKKY